MKTENVSTLKIHKLSQEQYDRELAAGTLDDNAIYMTPGEEIDLSPYATITQLNGKANTSHTHDASNITSGTLSTDRLPTVPVSKGGTGATTAAAARSTLGITPANIGAAASSHNHDASNITSGKISTARLPVIPIDCGGTGASTVAGARKYLGLGNTDGALPIANGGTGSYSVAGARANLGLGATDGALPIGNGGTGATSAHQARSNLGITAANIGAASVSHNHDDRYVRSYGLNTLNIDMNSGNWTVAISDTSHGTVPESFVQVTQFQSENFYVQIAIKCDNSGDTSRKTSGMWIRNKHALDTGDWSAWTRVMLG